MRLAQRGDRRQRRLAAGGCQVVLEEVCRQGFDELGAGNAASTYHGAPPGLELDATQDGLCLVVHAIQQRAVTFGCGAGAIRVFGKLDPDDFRLESGLGDGVGARLAPQRCLVVGFIRLLDLVVWIDDNADGEVEVGDDIGPIGGVRRRVGPPRDRGAFAGRKRGMRSPAVRDGTEARLAPAPGVNRLQTQREAARRVAAGVQNFGLYLPIVAGPAGHRLLSRDGKALDLEVGQLRRLGSDQALVATAGALGHAGVARLVVAIPPLEIASGQGLVERDDIASPVVAPVDRSLAALVRVVLHPDAGHPSSGDLAEIAPVIVSLPCADDGTGFLDE